MSGSTPWVFTQKMGFGKKTGFGTFYSLVSSSFQVDGIRIGFLPKGASTPWAGFGTKTGFGTFYSLVSSSPQTDGIRMGSFLEGTPTAWGPTENLVEMCLL